MFYGAVSDFFAQAVISFMLGQRNLGVFNEFLENLESTDHSALMQQSRVRAAASELMRNQFELTTVETSSARVLDNGEQRIGGWTLLSPAERNTRLSPKLEEKVLLLVSCRAENRANSQTKLALYVVSFNYSLEKVNEFTRIPLKSITSLQKGAYILSALQEAGRDPTENAGFVVTFAAADESTRYSTYSLDNTLPTPTPTTPTSTISKASASTSTDDNPLKPDSKRNRARTLSFKRKSIMKLADVDPDTSEFFAFKALPREFVAQPHPEEDEDEEFALESNETCLATVDRIVKRIRDQCAKVHQVADEFVVDKDVVSVADAENATSLLARMDYAVKRFLWL